MSICLKNFNVDYSGYIIFILVNERNNIKEQRTKNNCCVFVFKAKFLREIFANENK